MFVEFKKTLPIQVTHHPYFTDDTEYQRGNVTPQSHRVIGRAGQGQAVIEERSFSYTLGKQT